MSSQEKIKLNSYQALFTNAPEQYVGLFGGIGNGKTMIASAKIIELCATFPDNLALVGRLTYPELRDSTKEEFMQTLRKMYPQEAYKESKSENSVTLWNGSAIIFRHLDNPASLLGPNLGAFYVDQAEEVDEEAFLTLQGRLRRPNIPILKGMVTGNPAGHNWVYYKFGMDKGWNDTRHESDWRYGNNYRMITAPTHANSANLPQNYIDQLRESYSDNWFNRYVLGSWDGFEGQIFNIAQIRGYDKLPKILMVITGCDPAISEKKEACNTAFCTLGVGDDGFIYDLETIAGHWKFIETLDQTGGIVSRMSKHKVQHYLGVENVAYQSALTEACLVHYPEIHIENVKADKDKFRRAKSVSHIIDKGLFRTNNQELLNEMIAFDPGAKGKARKDRVDALVHALHMVQMYAPIKTPAVPKPWEEFKGLDSHQAWFKMTRDYERKKMAQEGETIEEFSGSAITPNPDFY